MARQVMTHDAPGIAVTETWNSLFDAYTVLAGSYDEMFAAPGVLWPLAHTNA